MPSKGAISQKDSRGRVLLSFRAMHPMLLQIPTSLETERLRLRAYREGDGREYFAMIRKNKEHLAHVMPDFVLGLKDEEEAEILIRHWMADWAARNKFCLGMWEKEGGAFAGEVYIQGMDWEVPVIELGYYADMDHQGRGLVSEAVGAALGFIFRHLGAHKVCVTCDNANVKSHRVAERCGFVEEGLLRDQKRRPDGTYISSKFYGMLRSEFEALGKT